MRRHRHARADARDRTSHHLTARRDRLRHAVAAGAGPDQARHARAAVERSLSLLTPEEDEAILRDAGFSSCGDGTL